ncbi:VOC family protein [Streptomyces anulatus]
MLRIGIPVLGVTDVARAAAFWTAALHLDVSPQWHSETWRTLSHRDDMGPALGLMHSTSPPGPRPPPPPRPLHGYGRGTTARGSTTGRPRRAHRRLKRRHSDKAIQAYTSTPGATLMAAAAQWPPGTSRADE